VIVLLRFISIFNLAVWFGACVFFTVGVAPALFSDEMKGLLQQSYPVLAGRLAILLISRYYLLHYWCAALALLHQLAERFYLGKPLQRVTLGLLISLCAFSLLGGLWLQPKLTKLHAAKYGRSEIYTPAQRLQAASSFKTWHGVAFFINLLVLGGTGVYLWRVANPLDTPRFVPTGKFRS